MKNQVPTRQIKTQIRRPWPVCLGLIGLLAALAISPQCCAEPGDQASEIKAVRLTQSHLFLGPTQLTLSPTHVRLDSTGQMHFTMVSSAPDWTVTVFRNDDRVIKSESLRQFIYSGLVSEIVLSSRPRVVSSGAPPYAFKYYGFDARRVTNQYFTNEYLTLKGVTAPEVEQILYSAYRMPTGGGVPLRYIATDNGRDFITGMQLKGQKAVDLTTSSAKTVLVSKDFFTPPKNYRLAKAMQEVVTSSKVRDQSADFQSLLEPDAQKSKDTVRP